MFSENQSYYDILEITKNATSDDILKAYLKSKLTYSSDSPALYSMFSKEEAYELLKLIEEAYTVLNNPIEKQRYDKNMQSIMGDSELPDISFNEVPDSQWDATVNAEPTENTEEEIKPPETVPEGFKKTKFSVYEIKPEIEEEINTAQMFNGPFLQKIRIYKNITSDQLIKELRLSRSYLAGIEADDYEVLPAKVFVRGFLVQIAKSLHLDEIKVANSYIELYNESKK